MTDSAADNFWDRNGVLLVLVLYAVIIAAITVVGIAS